MKESEDLVFVNVPMPKEKHERLKKLKKEKGMNIKFVVNEGIDLILKKHNA